jgi:hypothetical protein
MAFTDSRASAALDRRPHPPRSPRSLERGYQGRRADKRLRL